MCLSVPVKVIKIEDNQAVGSLGGAEVNLSLHLVDDVREGDYVLVHTGFAIEKISEEEALETLELLQQLAADEPEKPLEE